MTENENRAKQILDAAFRVRTKLGLGLFESVYEVIMGLRAKRRGLTAERQKAMPIMYDDIRFDEAFRSDIVVNGRLSRNSNPWKCCFQFMRSRSLRNCA